jgi:hypothetical protein
MDVNMTAGYDQTWIDTDDLRIMTCRLTCGYDDWFDMMCYPKKRSILNRKAEPTVGGLGRRRVWCLLCVMVFTLLFSKDYSVAADNSIPNLKLYALNAFKTYEQFDCYNYIVITFNLTLLRRFKVILWRNNCLVSYPWPIMLALRLHSLVVTLG